MDFQEFVDQYQAMTCLISVEKKPDGKYGTIRIVTGNAAYIASIEDPSHMASAEMLDNRFIPNCEYTKYIPKDLNFEDIVYQAAILGHPMHTYIHPERYSFWINIFVMPLKSDDPDIGYCTYTMELTVSADLDLMSNLSAETAAAVLKTCIKLRGQGDIYDNFNNVVEDIRQICGSDHCCVLLVDPETQSCEILGESIQADSGLLPFKTYNTAGFYAITETWKDTIAGSTCIIIEDEGDMAVLKERNPVWHASLKSAGVNSVVLFPLQYGDETLGYIWAINFNTDNTMKIKETLELSTFFMAAEISNHKLVERLKIMSSIDLLTGVMNRNAMNTRIDSIVQEEHKIKPVGVVFADINGLKYTNDHEGHSAGDTLIINAAAVLKRTYGDCEVFRAGGDEFMILVSNTDEEEFYERIRQLKAHSVEADGVDFAVGGCYCGDALDIRLAMRVADEQMYLDKENYYEKYPERRR